MYNMVQTGTLHLTHPKGEVGNAQAQGLTPDLSHCLGQGTDWKTQYACYDGGVNQST